MYQQQLSNLLHTNDINRKGVVAVIGVPRQGIEDMPDVLTLSQQAGAEPCDFFTEEITLKSGYQWRDISKDFHLNIVFEEENKITKQGELFTYNVSVPLSNDSFERAKVLRAYQGCEWVLIVKETTGAWRVIGSKTRGAVFTDQLQTGTILKGANRIDTGFTWQSGRERAFYVKNFDYNAYFDVVFNYSLSPQTTQRLVIDETVMIDWGSNRSFYKTPDGVLQTISKTITGVATTLTARVYHRHRAVEINLSGTNDYNNNIQQLTGTLPNQLEELNVSTNMLTQLPTNSFTNNLQTLDAEENEFNDSSLEAILEKLDLLAASNGSVNVSSQSPAVTPTTDMNTFKANLEAKGWTVTF